MKRFGIIFGLTTTIIILLSMVTLLIMALIHNNNYSPYDSIVFIEAINNESIKDGMGFVYEVSDNKNYIVTNYHVVESSNSLYVENINREKISAKVVWYDVYTDIAVLQINNELGLKEILPINQKSNINDSVYYYNIENKELKKGKILSLNNEININTSYGNSYYMANSINANINNGNSGSPLFNDKNEFIGMICLKEEGSDSAYYLEYNYIEKLVSKLKNQELFRPNLGASFVNTTNIDLLNQYEIFPGDIVGVVIIDLKEGFPLKNSGLVQGDIITKINDIQITNSSELQKTLYSFKPNDIISIEYVRSGGYNRVDIVLK